MRIKGGNDAVLEADLGGFGGRGGREVDVGSQEKIPMYEKATAGNFSGATILAGGGGSEGDHGGALGGEDGGFETLRFATAAAETPGCPQHPHFCCNLLRMSIKNARDHSSRKWAS